MVLLDSSSPRQLTDIPSYPGQYAVMRRGLGAAAHRWPGSGSGPVLAGSHLPADDAAPRRRHDRLAPSRRGTAATRCR